MFAVGLPLIFEQRMLSSRLSSWYVTNFLSGMVVYFFVTAILSVLVYLFVKNRRAEIRIFAITLLVVFLGTLGVSGTISSYYGNQIDPFWLITWLTGFGQSRAGYFLFFFVLFLLLVSLLISGILIVSYNAYRIVRTKRGNYRLNVRHH
jgi:hypothetical protein